MALIDYSGKQQIYNKDEIDTLLSEINSDVGGINEEIDRIKNSINAEERARTAADDTEASTRAAADNAINERIDNLNFATESEVLKQVSELRSDMNTADINLGNRITSTRSELLNAISVVDDKTEGFEDLVTQEKAAREDADNLINTKLQEIIEVTDPHQQELIAELSNKIAQEVDDRSDAVNELRSYTDAQLRIRDRAIQDEQSRAEVIEENLGKRIDNITIEAREIAEEKVREATDNMDTVHESSAEFINENLTFMATQWTADYSDEAFEGTFYELTKFMNVTIEGAELPANKAKLLYIKNGFVKLCDSLPPYSGLQFGQPSSVAANKEWYQTINWVTFNSKTEWPVTSVEYTTPALQTPSGERKVATQDVQSFIDYRQNAINYLLDLRSSENRAKFPELEFSIAEVGAKVTLLSEEVASKLGGFTFVIDSNSALDAWVKHKPDNDYSYILVKRGTWENTFTETVNFTDTKVIVGEYGASITLSSHVRYLSNVYNLGLTFLMPAGKYADLSPVMSHCENYHNCTINIDTSAISAADNALYGCNNFYNCSITFTDGGKVLDEDLIHTCNNFINCDIKSDYISKLSAGLMVNCAFIRNCHILFESHGAHYCMNYCVNILDNYIEHHNNDDTRPTCLYDCERVINNKIMCTYQANAVADPSIGGILCSHCVIVLQNTADRQDSYGTKYTDSYASSKRTTGTECADTANGGWNS